MRDDDKDWGMDETSLLSSHNIRQIRVSSGYSSSDQFLTRFPGSMVGRGLNPSLVQVFGWTYGEGSLVPSYNTAQVYPEHDQRLRLDPKVDCTD